MCLTSQSVCYKKSKLAACYNIVCIPIRAWEQFCVVLAAVLTLQSGALDVAPNQISAQILNKVYISLNQLST